MLAGKDMRVSLTEFLRVPRLVRHSQLILYHIDEGLHLAAVLKLYGDWIASVFVFELIETLSVLAVDIIVKQAFDLLAWIVDDTGISLVDKLATPIVLECCLLGHVLFGDQGIHHWFEHKRAVGKDVDSLFHLVANAD